MRLYRFPKDRLHILDGGIEAWRRAGQPTTTEVPEADLADGLRRPVELGERDDDLVATYEDVLSWSGEASARVLMAHRASSTSGAGRVGGHGLRAHAAATSRGPAAPLRDLLTDEGTFRPVDEMVSLVARHGRRTHGDPRHVLPGRGSRRARLVRPPQLAGVDGVRSYGGLVGGVGESPRYADQTPRAGMSP